MLKKIQNNNRKIAEVAANIRLPILVKTLEITSLTNYLLKGRHLIVSECLAVNYFACKTIYFRIRELSNESKFFTDFLQSDIVSQSNWRNTAIFIALGLHTVKYKIARTYLE